MIVECDRCKEPMFARRIRVDYGGGNFVMDTHGMITVKNYKDKGPEQPQCYLLCNDCLGALSLFLGGLLA